MVFAERSTIKDECATILVLAIAKLTPIGKNFTHPILYVEMDAIGFHSLQTGRAFRTCTDTTDVF